ncbi:hypothetical protein L3Q82_025343 [Scortum barcoo]|uniref:Uncharacterized protein n=1 Tax=Scortum barcoo TaxID=214431 RepID=A0ACB8WP62_9TELE|nr:hypothetical protein L3Q82_025343 [Scortum barcoo]
MQQFEAVDARSLVPVVVATPKPGDGHWKWGAAVDLILYDYMIHDIVGQWKEYIEDLLNPTDTPSTEEAEAEDSEVDSFKLLAGKAPGGGLDTP